MQWNITHPTPVTEVDELKQVLLANRGITDEESFFHPVRPESLTLAAVGLDSAAMSAAVARIEKAIAFKEKVIVFGDYDADGICATAVMWLSLHNLGCQAIPFIPDRLKHGYGLSSLAIADILSQGKPDLVITVDNGIVAHQAVEMLNQAGVEVIITDHHSPEATLPPAAEIVHTTKLCGTTVAWMFGRELNRALNGPLNLPSELLDLCGIATIADQVPLREANRSFAYWGVEALKITERAGIKAICQLAEINQAEMTTNSVHYGLAPRINAMGRLEHGMDALRLLCTKNVDRAQSLAASISSTNVRRQTLTEELLNDALTQAKNWEKEHVIVVSSPDYHEGVIGLIAGKLMETYYKPAIVISIGETKAKASARSIAGVNIVELIRLVREDLLEVGGHPMAAGFGLAMEKVDVVTQRLQNVAREQITTAQLVPQLNVETALSLKLATEPTVMMVQSFAPFGQGNHEPIFAFNDLRVLKLHTMGQSQQHVKLTLVAADDPGAGTITALGWNLARLHPDLAEGQILNVAGCLELNEWKNRRSVQLKIKDLQLPPADKE